MVKFRRGCEGYLKNFLKGETITLKHKEVKIEYEKKRYFTESC